MYAYIRLLLLSGKYLPKPEADVKIACLDFGTPYRAGVKLPYLLICLVSRDNKQ
jgi:hypothetical protein